MFRFLVILLSITFIAQPAFAEGYKLEDLYKLALKQSERMSISQEDTVIAQLGKDKAVSSLLPKVSAYVSATFYDEQKKTPAGMTIQPESTRMWGLRLEQSFNLGGRELKSYGISKEAILKSNYEQIVTRQDVLFAVASAYFERLRAKKSIDIAKSNIQRLSKYKDAAELRLKVGEATRTAVLRAEAELAQAVSELAKAESAFAVASANISRLTGIPLDAVILEYPIDNLTARLDDLDTLKSKAFANRPEIKALQMQRQILSEQVKVAKSAHYPTLSFEGVYGRRSDTPQLTSIVRESLYAGLRLTLPIFEGGLRVAEVKELHSRLRQIDLSLSDLEKSILLDLQRAYAEYQANLKLLKSNEAMVNFATDNYYTVSRQYELGLASTLDVVDANNFLTAAQRQLADSQYSYELTVIKIRRIIGEDIYKE